LEIVRKIKSQRIWLTVGAQLGMLLSVSAEDVAGAQQAIAIAVPIR